MDKQTRKDWDEVLGLTPPKEEFIDLRDDIFFDLKKLLWSILCILSIITVLVMFLTYYYPEKEIYIRDLYGKYLPSIILYIVILILFAKPVFIFILSFIADEWGFILVPLVIILLFPFILIILFIVYTQNIIENCRRPKL